MIDVRHVSKWFGEQDPGRRGAAAQRIYAVRDVSVTLAAGSTTVIHGPSGSGKTTLLRLIAGLARPDDGEVWLDGELASAADWVMTPHRRGVGFVFQEAALWPHMTVAQNVGFGLLDRPRRELAARVDAALEAMGLAELGQRYPSQLSGGQARRVAIARTLVVNPQILLLDEPLTHLQPELRIELLELIQAQVAERGVTLVYVTHNEGEAAQLGGRQMRMDAGRLEEMER